MHTLYSEENMNAAINPKFSSSVDSEEYPYTGLDLGLLC